MGDVRRLDGVEKTLKDLKREHEDSSSTVLARLGSHAHDDLYRLLNGDVPIALGGKIIWAGDTNLYRDGANSLATDDSFTVNGPALYVLSGPSYLSSIFTNSISPYSVGDISIGRITGSNSSLNFRIQSDPSASGWRFFWNGTAPTFVRNDTNTVVKTFIIDHPIDDERYLVHATTESPHNGVEYGASRLLQMARRWSSCRPTSRR